MESIVLLKWHVHNIERKVSLKNIIGPNVTNENILFSRNIGAQNVNTENLKIYSSFENYKENLYGDMHVESIESTTYTPVTNLITYRPDQLIP